MDKICAQNGRHLHGHKHLLQVNTPPTVALLGRWCSKYTVKWRLHPDWPDIASDERLHEGPWCGRGIAAALPISHSRLHSDLGNSVAILILR